MKPDLTRPPLTSILAKHILEYISEKRALGAKYESEAYTLRLLDRFLTGQKIKAADHVNPTLIERFLASRDKQCARSFNYMRNVVLAFFDSLVRHGISQRNPVQVPKRRVQTGLQPFIFSPEQAKRLLEAAVKLPPSERTKLRGEMFRTIFGLLYGLGLRTGEVRRLIISDIDFAAQTLLIRESKFSKTRLLPFGPRIAGMLKEHLDRKRKMGHPVDPHAPVFSCRGDRPLSTSPIKHTFRLLMKELGIQPPPGCFFPRPHHLRHSFAVGRLLRWYREGTDVSQRLYALSTFLGHVDPASTQVYLTITGDLLAEAGRRLEKYAPIPSISPEAFS